MPPPIPGEAILLGAVSGVLEAAYFVFLAAAYRRGDLSVVYPIARGTAPLLAVGIGVGVLGERLGPAGFAGVGLLLVGLLMLQRPWRYFRRSADGSGFDPAIGFALLTGVMIASYSAVDRVGARLVEPWLYAGLIWAACTVFLWTWVLVSGQVTRWGVRHLRVLRHAPGGLRWLDHARRVPPDPRRVERRALDRGRPAPGVGDRARVGVGDAAPRRRRQPR